MFRKFLNLSKLQFSKINEKNSIRKKPKICLSYQPKITKTFFVSLFIAAFFFVLALTWLFETKDLPVVAQTPAGVTNTQEITNPNPFVQQASKLYREGQVSLAQGKPEDAAKQFADAATNYEQGGDKIGAIKSRINQAQALRKGGFYSRALDILKQLNDNLPNEIDHQLKAIARRSLGITQRLVGNLDESEKNIKESLKIAQTLDSPAREENSSAAYLMLGNIAKDRGNTAKERSGASEELANSQEPMVCNEQINEQAPETAPEERSESSYFQEAIACYQRATDTATTPTARIEAQLNQLSVFGDSGQPFTEIERELLRQVRQTIDTLPLSRTKVHARINWARMVMEPKNEANVSPQDIARQLAIAFEEAKKLQDQRSQSYALGQLGTLRQQLGQLEQARGNTQQALQIAQSIGANDIASRWQWQLGQILAAKGGEQDRQGAIASYDAAIKNLESIRGDLVSLNPDTQFSFRESVEPVYREYAELLLSDDNPQNLEKARTAIEALQQAELVNFLRANCLTGKPKSIDQIDQKAAVIYPIVLNDRLNVVVTLPNPEASVPSNTKLHPEKTTLSQKQEASEPPKTILRNYRTTLSQKQVEEILRDLRGGGDGSRAAAGIDLKPTEGQTRARKGPQGYLPLAQQVYGWLIKPFEADLEKSDVKTLVFILDRPLLNLPMAVLHDGEKFLMEKYAIAQTPGLQLLDSKPSLRGELTALKAGLSEARDVKIGNKILPFGALSNVQEELEQIQKEVSGKKILNDEFTTEAIQQAIDSARFPVVHLATHGQFSSKAEETFILTHDGVLNIEQLHQVLRGRAESGRDPIELLVLSACETAKGDKKAALGLAGVAVRAGARSTLATLWQVDDQSTAKLMIKFYEELKNTKNSKAEALRQAQLWLMQQDEKYKDPYYWAPFVLVGNWL